MRALLVGDDALLVEVASGRRPRPSTRNCCAAARRACSPSARSSRPPARSSSTASPTRPAWPPNSPPRTYPRSPRAREVVELPVRYDGPDLADVAALWGVPEREVARIHAATEFRVAFCGFAPGFGYLTGLPARYDVPRRATPRTAVHAGAVGLAGPYTGVYPRASPGGWQLIGTTDAVLWDTAREPAALLSPGTRVRFVPVADV